jgi:hypothetical protein
MIPIRLHAMIDYAFGALLIVVAFTAVPADAGAARAVLIITALFATLYSLMTDYALSLSRIIPFRVHLVLDALVGLVLLLSPWVLGFVGSLWLPHVILGLVSLGVTGLTQRPLPVRR